MCFGAEFVASHVRYCIVAVGAKTASFEPGSPWENGYVESCYARFRDELLDGRIFSSLHEAHALVEARQRHYNTARPMVSWATDRWHRKPSRRKAGQLAWTRYPLSALSPAVGDSRGLHGPVVRTGRMAEGSPISGARGVF